MTPHATNTRRACAETAEKYADMEPLFGIEQEYTFFKDGRPYGFPFGGFPAPQGGYYSGVGDDEVYGRDVRSEEHTSELQSLMRISYAVFCLQKKRRAHISTPDT